MNMFFVTGTDTGVGKTVVAALLTLLTQGCYWKPIQAGTDELTDTQQVQQWTGLPAAHFLPSAYCLQASLAPNQAAAREHKIIELSHCQRPITDKPLIIEGAGGVLVPLNSQHLMIDLIQSFNCPVIIVARGTLGTINHSLLTIAALRQRQIPIHGMIFNGDLHPENQRDIEQYGQVKTLLHLPRVNTLAAKTTWMEWTKKYSGVL